MGGCWYGNYKRSQQDKKYPILVEGDIPDVQKEAELFFPQKDKFFRDGYESPLYFVKEEDIASLQKVAKNQLITYKEALDFWEKEIQK